MILPVTFHPSNSDPHTRNAGGRDGLCSEMVNTAKRPTKFNRNPEKLVQPHSIEYSWDSVHSSSATRENRNKYELPN